MQIRTASQSFSPWTASTLDGGHPRHLAMLSDDGLRVLAIVYELVERLGFFPRQIYFMVMPLLEKPRGGLRAILL